LTTTPRRGVVRLFAVLAAALTISALSTPVAIATPQLKLTFAASVDPGPHLVGKPFPVSLSVTNETDQPLTGIHATSSRLSGSWLNVSEWGDLDLGGPGVAIDPGATRTFTLSGLVYSWQDSAPRVRFHAWIPDWEQQAAELTIPMIDPTTVSGTGGGVVYGDQNGNQTADPGEGLAGATVSIFAGMSRYETSSDAQGRFTFTGVPAQRYGVGINDVPGGWVVPYTDPRLDVTGDTPGPDVQLRAVRPLTDQLKLVSSLDRETYQPGDTAQVTFTFTNVGTEPLTGITMGCDRVGGAPQHIVGWESWSDLNYPATLTFAPGESRTFVETGTVPQVANQYGGFSVSCDFGPEIGQIEGYPTAWLWGRVPGTPGDSSGWIYHDANHNSTQDPGEAITTTNVTLADAYNGQTVATGVTDSDGHIAFTALPAGRYILNVDGWVSSYSDGAWIQAGTCQSCAWEWSLTFKPAQ
jgi:hypothetical protein